MSISCKQFKWRCRIWIFFEAWRGNVIQIFGKGQKHKEIFKYFLDLSFVSRPRVEVATPRLAPTAVENRCNMPLFYYFFNASLLCYIQYIAQTNTARSVTDLLQTDAWTAIAVVTEEESWRKLINCNLFFVYVCLFCKQWMGETYRDLM